jgi:hypothetical protein
VLGEFLGGRQRLVGFFLFAFKNLFS